MTLSIAAITKLLSDRGTNNLGCFERKYMFDPIGEAAHSRYINHINVTIKSELTSCYNEPIDRDFRFHSATKQLSPQKSN
jgi:hypothetical protein